MADVPHVFEIIRSAFNTTDSVVVTQFNVYYPINRSHVWAIEYNLKFFHFVDFSFSIPFNLYYIANSDNGIYQLAAGANSRKSAEPDTAPGCDLGSSFSGCLMVWVISFICLSTLLNSLPRRLLRQSGLCVAVPMISKRSCGLGSHPQKPLHRGSFS